MVFNVILALGLFILSFGLNWSIETALILTFGSLITCICCDIYEQGRDK